MNETPKDPQYANIRASMNLKETDELLEIWRRNDRQEWRQAVFPIVKEILLERLGEVPEQGQAPEKPVEERNPRKSSGRAGFVTGWVVFNLFGWMIGIYSLLGRGQDVYSHLEITGMWQLPDGIGGILAMICIPLGLGLGILQCLELGRWKIAKVPWVIATFLGWALPALAFSQIRRYLLFHEPMGPDFVNYLGLLWLLYPLALLALGAGIGLLQVLVMDKAMSRPGLWVLANALGLLVFGYLVEGILRLALEPMFTDIFVLAERGDPLIPPYLVFPIIGFFLPFLAALVTALPTGFVLWKFGKIPEEVNENIDKAA